MNTQNRLHIPNHNEKAEANSNYYIYSEKKHVVSVYSLHNIWIFTILSSFVRFYNIGLLFIVYSYTVLTVFASPFWPHFQIFRIDAFAAK